jgi:hypothetical protein
MKRAAYKDFIPGVGDNIQISKGEIAAINAVVDGRATPDQAKIAFEWMLREACQLGQAVMVLGGEDGRRATDHLLGRQYAGQMVRRVISPEFYQRRSGGNPVAEDKALHT